MCVACVTAEPRTKADRKVAAEYVHLVILAEFAAGADAHSRQPVTWRDGIRQARYRHARARRRFVLLRRLLSPVQAFRWTVEAAIEEAVPADVLTSALYARFRSRQEHTFGEKMLSVMRFGFGGHIEGNEPIDPEPKPKASQGGSAAKDAAK